MRRQLEASAAKLRAAQITDGPTSYYRLGMAIIGVDGNTSPDSLSAIVKSLYHADSKISLVQRTELTTSLMTRLNNQPAHVLFATLSQMLPNASDLANSICADSQQQSLTERPSKADMDCLDDMLVSIKGSLAATPASSALTIKLQQEVEDCNDQVLQAQRVLQQAEEKRTAKRQELDLAQQQLEEQQQALLQNAETTKQQLGDYQASLEQALAELYQKPVAQLSVQQAHALVCTISNTQLDIERFQEQAIDGELLVDLSMTELEQLTSLRPLGVCHRVVHYAKLAAAAPQLELFQSDFEAAIEQLNDWLQQRNDPVGNKYRQKLFDLKVDIVTCGSLHASDFQALDVAPRDKRRLVELLQKASLSAKQQPLAPVLDNAEPKRLSPEEQQRVLEQVLEENQALAERLKQQQSQHREVPNELLCPITMDLMADPVLAEDGIVYDREAIATWLGQTGTSPMTRQAIGNELKPVLLLKSLIKTLNLE